MNKTRARRALQLHLARMSACLYDLALLSETPKGKKAKRPTTEQLIIREMWKTWGDALPILHELEPSLFHGRFRERKKRAA